MIKRKYIYLLLILLLPMALHTATAQTNRLYMSDVQLEAGSTSTLDVYMENTTDVVGFQFTLTVPEGITLLPQNVKSSERLAKHELVAQSIGANQYMFAAYSANNEAISAIQGVLFTIPVQVASDIEDNVRYELSMTQAVMGNKNGNNVLASASGSKIFVAGLPNLHVTSVDCSEAVAGRKMTVTWRVRNDGAGPTGDIGWKDYVWLTPDIQGGMNMTGLKLLQTIDNVTALQPGEWYDNSIEVELEERKYGKYHIVVTSDMYGFDKMELSPAGNALPEVYQPETEDYGYLFATGTASYDQLVESGESKGRSDNFFYKRINIAVPPLPNLRVSQVVAVVDNGLPDGWSGGFIISDSGLASSSLFYSIKKIKVTARITNTGEAPVSNAVVRDALYMSHSEDMTGDVYKMAVKNDTLNIQPGGEQLITFSTQLPYVWSGDTWFHVHVDTKDAVYEGAATTDNLGTSGKIECLQAPTPDFKVTSVSVPKQVTLGIPFDVTYKVKNVGPGKPYSTGWTDRIYVSNSNSTAGASRVESHRQTGGFVMDEKGNVQYNGDNYTATRSVKLNNLTAGTYYIYVKTDTEDDVYEYDGEGNNWSEPVATLVVAADLTAELLSVSPDTLYNNSQTTIRWKVKNIGNGTLQNIALTDAFYATPVNGNTSHYLGRSTNTVSIAPGSEKVLMANITLPNNSQLNGNMSVFVKTNTNGVVESTTGNNISAGIVKPFKYEEEAVNNPHPPITIGSRPNLVVANVTVSATITSGQEADISYQLKNIGAGATGVQVKQEVYLSQSASFNSQSAIACEIVSEQLSSMSDILLKYNGSLNTSMRIKVPGNIRGGKYYLHVIVNSDGMIEETKYTDNSASAYCQVNGSLPDLELSGLTVPTAVKTSVPFDVKWTMANVGTWDAVQTVCDVWLTASEKPVKLLKTVEVEALATHKSSNKSVTIQLEDDIVGSYGIMVVADSAHRQNELSRSNNRLTSPITVTQSPLPNLHLMNLDVDGHLHGGDTITVTALVRNIGNNSTHKEKWSDAFYLSTGYELDTKKDICLGSKVHVGELAQDGSYELTAKLRIPTNAHGYYLLYAVADDGKKLIETSRDDNTARMSIFVEDINDRPAQLIVGHVAAPATVKAGALTGIRYSVVNNGLYPATGVLRDAIYLSADNKWDESDIMVGVVEESVDIPPGQSLYREAVGRVTNVSEGDYNVIVRTNSTHTIVESDYDDNMCVETSSCRVNFSQLSLGGGPATFYQKGYFKLPVEDVGQSATIGFTLGHELDQQAGLYVAYERVPSTARFDYASSHLNTTNQSVLVPNAKPGTYYVLAQRNDIDPNGYNRWVTSKIEGGKHWTVVIPIPELIDMGEIAMNLSAREVQFGATRLSIREGGTDGWVTTDIQGALFDSIMDFRLVRNKDMIPIETLTYNDQTSTRVTFNLNRAETGVYDVVSELPDGTQATLPNGFTVVPGVSSALGVKIDMPHWIRRDNYVPITITYANSGNTDVVIREFLFATEDGVLSTTMDGLLKEPQHELHLLPDGKQDSRGYITIPPGMQSAIRCYFKQRPEVTPAHLTLYLVN
ncbi:MAG: hypothetical protein J5658_05985 [Prevotella sp.]|nr:hypothetical protein [Prevotella sp.]